MPWWQWWVSSTRNVSDPRGPINRHQLWLRGAVHENIAVHNVSSLRSDAALNSEVGSLNSEFFSFKKCGCLCRMSCWQCEQPWGPDWEELPNFPSRSWGKPGNSELWTLVEGSIKKSLISIKFFFYFGSSAVIKSGVCSISTLSPPYWTCEWNGVQLQQLFSALSAERLMVQGLNTETNNYGLAALWNLVSCSKWSKDPWVLSSDWTTLRPWANNSMNDETGARCSSCTPLAVTLFMFFQNNTVCHQVKGECPTFRRKTSASVHSTVLSAPHSNYLRITPETVSHPSYKANR